MPFVYNSWHNWAKSGIKMKTIGLIGGMSYPSTSVYYDLINQKINEKLGLNNSAKIILYSFNFEEIEHLQFENKWQELQKMIENAGVILKNAGADFCIICTNTMHKVAENFEENTGLKLLHIADVTAKCLLDDGVKKVGLLGTKFTMNEDFYKKRLEDNFGLEVLVPKDQNLINDIIYNELVKGIITKKSEQIYLNQIQILQNKGAEAIILGCTQIGLLIKNHSLKLYDTTQIHAQSAALFALDKRSENEL